MLPRCLFQPRLLIALPGLVLAAAFASCSNSGGPSEVYPTTGELFVRGEPAAGALVAFHPLQGESPELWPMGFPHAFVDAAGKFIVSTYAAADGCPPGEYVVLVTWPAASPSIEEEGEEDVETVDRLGGRYATREDSPLTATVEARPTTLPRYDLH